MTFRIETRGGVELGDYRDIVAAKRACDACPLGWRVVRIANGVVMAERRPATWLPRSSTTRSASALALGWGAA